MGPSRNSSSIFTTKGTLYQRFFKKGLRDLSLVHMLTMKDPSSFEEMLAIANKYAVAEEVTLDNRDTQKDKEPGQSDRPSTSKNNDKKRKLDHSVAGVHQLCYNKIEYWPWPEEFEGFLDRICIFHPKKSTRFSTATDCRGL
jgi:hypothetical protein